MVGAGAGPGLHCYISTVFASRIALQTLGQYCRLGGAAIGQFYAGSLYACFRDYNRHSANPVLLGRAIIGSEKR
jgi:hypothetical protein